MTFAKSIVTLALTALTALLLDLVVIVVLRRYATDRFVERVRRRWRDSKVEHG